MRAMRRKLAKRKAIIPATPKNAWTPKTIKKDNRLLPVVITELRAPIKMRNAPSRPIIVIAWSITKDFQENANVRRCVRSCTDPTWTDFAAASEGTETGSTLAGTRTGDGDAPVLLAAGRCEGASSAFLSNGGVGKLDG